MATRSARFLLLCLERLFPIAPYHDDGEEASDDGGAKDDEDYGNANSPDARGEEGVERMVLVDEGLRNVIVRLASHNRQGNFIPHRDVEWVVRGRHTINSVQTV